MDEACGSNISVRCRLCRSAANGRNTGLVAWHSDSASFSVVHWPESWLIPQFVQLVYSLTVWFTRILSTVNILLVIWRFKELFTHPVRREMSPADQFSQHCQSLHSNLRTMFIVVFSLPVVMRFYFQTGGSDGWSGANVELALARGSSSSPLSRHFSPDIFIIPHSYWASRSFCSAASRQSGVTLCMVLPFVAVANEA